MIQKAETGEFHVRKFWLGGFFNSKNLITTMLQDVARRTFTSIEQLTIEYRLMNHNEKEMSFKKAESLNYYYL